jgi:fructose/tagatose bisphosphate aldolase
MPHVDMKDMLHHTYDNGCMVRAINLGCYGIMLHASHEPTQKSIRCNRTMVDIKHTDGVPVEGKPGYLRRAEGHEMSGLSGESGDEQTPGREVNPCRVAITLPDRSIVKDR